jgi:hypothetical protein
LSLPRNCRRSTPPRLVATSIVYCGSPSASAGRPRFEFTARAERPLSPLALTALWKPEGPLRVTADPRPHLVVRGAPPQTCLLQHAGLSVIQRPHSGSSTSLRSARSGRRTGCSGCPARRHPRGHSKRTQRIVADLRDPWRLLMRARRPAGSDGFRRAWGAAAPRPELPRSHHERSVPPRFAPQRSSASR